MILNSIKINSNEELKELINTLPQNTLFYSNYFGFGKLVGKEILGYNSSSYNYINNDGRVMLVLYYGEVLNDTTLYYFNTTKSQDNIYIISSDKIDDELVILDNGRLSPSFRVITIDGKKYDEREFREINGIKYHISKLIFCNECDDYHLPTYICKKKLAKLDSYHSGKSKKIQKHKSKYTVGLEIEKNKKLTPTKIIKLKQNGWRCETDGSVNGGEYITPILNLSHKTHEYFNQFSFLFENKDNYYNCGGHIHIGGINQDDLYKIIDCYRPILWGLYPERKNERYCRYNNPPTIKYSDVFKHIQGTVEIRIFPATTSINKIKFRLALIRFMLSNGVKTPNEITKMLLTKRFIKILTIESTDINILTKNIKNIFNEYKTRDNNSLSYSENEIKNKIINKI